MQTLTVDVAILGAGSAGLNARKEVIKAGKSYVLIDGGPYGTTCARVGCMPSKLLIAAADAAHHVATARQFGIEVDPAAVRVNAAAVFDRVRAERDRFVGFVVEDTEAIPESERLRGYARFLSDTVLEVGDHTRVEAKTVVVATGSAPWIPPNLAPVADRVLVNDDVFELTEVPERLAVFGTGIIGLELGQALHRLGSKVSFFNPFDVIGPFTDPKVQAKAKEVLGAELDLRLGSQTTTVEPLDDGAVRIAWTDADGTAHDEVFTHVLAAAGRRPNIGKLGLENTTVPRDDKGRVLSDSRTLQAGDSPIFFAGDVAGHRPLLHEAADEGRIAGANAARFPDVAAHTRRTKLAVAFTHPQMGMVGCTHAQLDPAFTVVGEVSYDNQGRARVMGVNSGLVRLYADHRTGHLVGAELFGPAVEHTAHLLAWMVQLHMKVVDILALPFYHPVIEEGIRTGLRDLARGLKQTALCPPEDCAEAPGV